MAASFLCRTQIYRPGLIFFRPLVTAEMDPMGSASSRSPLECLNFDNVALKKLPLDPSQEPGADGRKVLRSSVREFLCSEAMFALGVPTTRAGSVVTSDLRVARDVFYNGRPRLERCSVVLRIAPTFVRFGSFEIFKSMDELTGRQGPSVGRDDIRAQLLDYVIDTFYPEIQQSHTDRAERNTAFFREVTVRTAKLVALWQCVGFCHGVLNTDNMSIVGVTLDYGPYGFMDRFDPDFVCNASDSSGRYSYQAQPAVCRWNLARLAEALGPELQPHSVEAVLDEYLPLYNAFYLGNMRRKLGLLWKQEPEDEMLVTDLLQTMHNTGADFTNTFRSLSQVSSPSGEEEEQEVLGHSVDLLMEQCCTLEELKEANKPTMDHRELVMLLSLAESNPALFNMLADKASVSKQLERLARLKELVDTNQEDLRAKQREDWTRWVKQYRKRLARDQEGQGDPRQAEEERTRTMDSANPRVVLRNYIAQNAIEAAEAGDFSEVQRVLKVLEKPFSAQPGLEEPGWARPAGGGAEGGAKEEGAGEEAGPAPQHPSVPYHSKPPTWAGAICVT